MSNEKVISKTLKTPNNLTSVQRKVFRLELLQMLFSKSLQFSDSYENVIISGYMDQIIDTSAVEEEYQHIN
jgi:hypothetical protein